MSSLRRERRLISPLDGAGDLPSEPFHGRPGRREDGDPGQRGGGLGPQTGADVLAGVSPNTTPPNAAPPNSTAHIAPNPDDGDDWDPFVSDDRLGEPGTCWVCGRDFEYSITDFAPDGPHSVCTVKARRMDAAFRAQRRSGRNATQSFNIWAVRW